MQSSQLQGFNGHGGTLIALKLMVTRNKKGPVGREEAAPPTLEARTLSL
jgi:hypothetical protein